jgi:chemotaxis family two-component system response regulator Rcp1
MPYYKSPGPINLLLVEDNLADIRLTQEVLKESKIHYNLNVVTDGEEAMDYLNKINKHAHAETPDLVILDLNIPKKDGREVLKEIKSDSILKSIPVIILTTSISESDILNTYNHHANCYLMKSIDLNEFVNVIKSIEDFWLTIVKLPVKEN